MSAHNYNPTAADELLQQINRSTDVYDFVESDEDSSKESFRVHRAVTIRLKRDSMIKSGETSGFIRHKRNRSPCIDLDISSIDENVPAAPKKAKCTPITQDFNDSSNFNDHLDIFDTEYSCNASSSNGIDLCSSSVSTQQSISDSCSEINTFSESGSQKSVSTKKNGKAASKKKKKVCEKSKPKKSADTGFVVLDFDMMAGDKINSRFLVTRCDHHIYGFNGNRKDGKRYRCRNRKCRAFVILGEDGQCKRFNASPKHVHKNSSTDVETKYWNLIALNEMRAICRNVAAIAGGRRIATIKKIFTDVKKK